MKSKQFFQNRSNLAEKDFEAGAEARIYETYAVALIRNLLGRQGPA